MYFISLANWQPPAVNEYESHKQVLQKMQIRFHKTLQKINEAQNLIKRSILTTFPGKLLYVRLSALW